jgi:hypothetical protein
VALLTRCAVCLLVAQACAAYKYIRISTRLRALNTTAPRTAGTAGTGCGSTRGATLGGEPADCVRGGVAVANARDAVVVAVVIDVAVLDVAADVVALVAAGASAAAGADERSPLPCVAAGELALRGVTPGDCVVDGAMSAGVYSPAAVRATAA